MATTVIQNCSVAGAMGALIAERSLTGVFTSVATAAPTAAVARAVANEFIAVNAVSGAPIADADNASIGNVVQACSFGAMLGRGSSDTTAADYLGVSGFIYFAAAAAKAQLV
jgi:hypothetical protein